MKNYRQEIILEEVIRPVQEGQYISIPFEVNDDTEQINIYIEYENDDINTIDLGMEDPYKVRGWSGGARRFLFLREDRATPGYDLDPIYNGEWSVILNAYKIVSNCTVKITVELLKKHERWLRGDIHLHTNHSDGHYLVTEVMHHATEVGLDFIALTDHNTFSQNTMIDQSFNLAVIPGVELTTNRGHCNFLGSKKPFIDFRCTTKEDVLKVIQEGQQNNALVSVNHPHCDFCPWEWGMDDYDFKYVEIWNGPWKASNKRTLDWWQNQLEKGEKIVAIGGSDKHGPHQNIEFGGPTTCVKSLAQQPNEILNAIKQGKVAVLANPRANQLLFNLEGKEIGDIVTISDNRKSLLLSCEISGEINGILKVISRKGLQNEITLKNGPHHIQLEVPAEEAGFYRVELWAYDNDTESEMPYCITNPIFIEKR